MSVPGREHVLRVGKKCKTVPNSGLTLKSGERKSKEKVQLSTLLTSPQNF